MATRVLTLAGRPIDYSRPPKPTDLVQWSQRDYQGDIVKGSFRTICHLDRLNRLAIAKYGRGIVVIQPPFNTGVAASAGTHDFDACLDIYIPGVDWAEQQRFFRANGLGCWWRKPPSFGNHIHGFTLPLREGQSISDDFKVGGFKVGKYVDGGWCLYGRQITSSQLGDYYAQAHGLSGQHTPGSDNSWHPGNEPGGVKATIFDLDQYIEHRLREQEKQEDTVTQPMKVHGSDVSHHQGALDLRRAKEAGLKFLYHKATEGTSVKDNEYDDRRTQAKRSGVPFGAYHFARPEGTDAVAEARYFIDWASPLPGDLIPCLDLEDSAAYRRMGHRATKEWAARFSAEVKRLTGVLPVLYCPWDLGLPNVRWVPRYNNSNTPPEIPWDIWQFSNGEFGVPNSFPGLGHVDLNTFHDGFGLRKILIPKAAEEPKKAVLKVAHLSLEVFDNDAARLDDLEKVLGRGYDFVTGTELTRDVAEKAAEIAKRKGYKLSHGRRHDTWVAVNEKRIKDGSWGEGTVHVLDSAPAVGDPHPYGGRGIRWAEWEDKEIGGLVAVGSIHFLTKGRWKGQAQDDKPHDPIDHYAANTEYAHACGDWAEEHGAGGAIAFVAGDTNLVDQRVDVFRGAPLTTSWDELERYENTGHGNIDVIASYDRDARVRATRVRALDDSESRFNTDHYLVETTFEVVLPE